MPRRPRIRLAGIPQHIVQRGINREPCFFAEEDYHSYLHWLQKAAADWHCAIHAYVLMTNHVHLLVTPATETGTAKLMQALGRRYVQYINRSYRRTGSLWEGRYKSSLIQAETYLLTCMRYIELNPVRAGMVQDPGQYRWSSYRHNGLGQADPYITPQKLTGKQLTAPCSVASWMRKPLATFGWPCHRGNHWAEIDSATSYVRRRESGAHRSDRGDRQANRINPATQKHKPISDSEQERMNMAIKRKNIAKLTPLVAAMLAWKIKFDSGQKDDDDLILLGDISYSDDWDTSIRDDWKFTDEAANDVSFIPQLQYGRRVA